MTEFTAEDFAWALHSLDPECCANGSHALNPKLPWLKRGRKAVEALKWLEAKQLRESSDPHGPINS